MKKKKRKKTEIRLPRLGNLFVGGVLAAVAGFIGLVIVYGAMNGGGGRDEFAPDIAETSSENGGEPFAGGARLHFPVDSIDMGQVPLNTNVSYAFAMTNVGDAAARIEDVDVSVMEGC